jgi:hypothetical protein
MSRLSAGIGAGVGGAVGSLIDGGIQKVLRPNNDAFPCGLGMIIGGITGAAVGAGSEAPKQIGVGAPQMITPAQASGYPDFVNDWPVQGPTDPGIREADCRYAQTLPTPAEAPCVDCKGYVPMFARTKGLLGEQVSFGGRRTRAFALAAAGDPDIWGSLTVPQQTWVGNTLAKLNDIIVKSTGTTCPQWAPAIHSAAFCFQSWFNQAGIGMTNSDGSQTKLRTDGTFDQETLNTLIRVVAINPTDFPTPYPGLQTAAPDKKLSTGAMVGIAAGAATVLGGVVYAATRKSGRKSRRRK